MTSASQFTGGHQVAIGESITLNHSLNQVTIDGQVFLRAGVLDTVAGYETSIATNPGLGVIVSNTSYTTSGLAAIPSPDKRNMVASAGSAVLVVGPSSFYKITDLTGTFTADSTYYNNYTWSNITDVISVPAATPYIFIAGYGPNYSNQYSVISYNSSGTFNAIHYPYSSAPSGTTYPQYYALASKPDGSFVLGVTYAINTSYNVFKWTPAAGATAPTITSGSMSGTPKFLGWSISASMFICVSSTGYILTTTDGLAWTARTRPNLLAGSLYFDTGISNIWGQSALWAHSATATNGIDYTTNSFATLGFYPGATVDATATTVSTQTRITCINNTFYIYRDNGSSSIIAPAVYTSNDGITWTAGNPIILNGQAPGTAITFLGTVNNNTFTLTQGGSSYIHSTLPSLSTTHIGLTSAKTNQYVRVK